jgi:hydrogenase maturation factor
VIVTAFSFVDDYVSSGDAREGDSILMSKTAGLEGTAVLRGSRTFLDNLSVVDEATAAYATGAVHAMHDCTEGGVLGAVFEMSPRVRAAGKENPRGPGDEGVVYGAPHRPSEADRFRGPSVRR